MHGQFFYNMRAFLDAKDMAAVWLIKQGFGTSFFYGISVKSLQFIGKG
jgi:hypothetical protein